MFVCSVLCVFVDGLSMMLVPCMMLWMMHDVMMMMMIDAVVPVMDRFSSACTRGKHWCGDGEGDSEAESRVKRRFHILGFPLVGNRRGGTATRRCRIVPPASLSDADVSALFPACGVSFLKCFSNRAGDSLLQQWIGHTFFEAINAKRPRQ